jgi:hypothetical protein
MENHHPSWLQDGEVGIVAAVGSDANTYLLFKEGHREIMMDLLSTIRFRGKQKKGDHWSLLSHVSI